MITVGAKVHKKAYSYGLPGTVVHIEGKFAAVIWPRMRGTYRYQIASLVLAASQGGISDELRPGDRVARRDVPGIIGKVVSVRNGWVWVRWSPHFMQSIFSKRLTLIQKREAQL